MLKEGNFRVLQSCYSKGGNPYLTGVSPVIPPPELPAHLGRPVGPSGPTGSRMLRCTSGNQ